MQVNTFMTLRTAQNSFNDIFEELGPDMYYSTGPYISLFLFYKEVECFVDFGLQ